MVFFDRERVKVDFFYVVDFVGFYEMIEFGYGLLFFFFRFVVMMVMIVFMFMIMVIVVGIEIIVVVRSSVVMISYFVYVL